MKTVGIIGGLGPESTIEYYRLILAGYREQRPDAGNPPIVINSINLPQLLSFMEAGELEKIAAYLTDEIHRLAEAKCSFAVLSANMPHIVFDQVQLQSPIPLISIVEVTCEVAKQMGFKKLALFGTRFVMQGILYPKVFSRDGIELIVPSSEEQDYIHQIYFGELVNGVVLPETRQKLLAILDRLRREQKIQGLILGGTELSLIFREPTALGLPILDTTRIHVNSIVAELLR
ncbi:MAG TPA: amino acid racemase [Candidatus Angelobacter sp.]